MNNLTFLTPRDVKILHKKADFTEDQLTILEHLRKGNLSDDGIRMELKMSRSKYYDTKNSLFIKIVRLAVQSTE